MSEIQPPLPDGDWPEGFEGARLANLFHFASLTPAQRLQWLTDMLELTRLARQAAADDSGSAGRGSAPD